MTTPVYWTGSTTIAAILPGMPLERIDVALEVAEAGERDAAGHLALPVEPCLEVVVMNRGSHATL